MSSIAIPAAYLGGMLHGVEFNPGRMNVSGLTFCGRSANLSDTPLIAAHSDQLECKCCTKRAEAQLAS